MSAQLWDGTRYITLTDESAVWDGTGWVPLVSGHQWDGAAWQLVWEALEWIPLHGKAGDDTRDEMRAEMAARGDDHSTVVTINYGFDLTDAETMQGMVSDCHNLEAIRLRNTQNVRSLYFAFNQARSLIKAPVMDTSNVITMYFAFLHCDSMIDAGTLDCSNVESAEGMFDSCGKLEAVTLPGMAVSFSVADTAMTGAALDDLFSSLAYVSGATISIPSGATGYDVSLATDRGWTVVGGEEWHDQGAELKNDYLLEGSSAWYRVHGYEARSGSKWDASLLDDDAITVPPGEYTITAQIRYEKNNSGIIKGTHGVRVNNNGSTISGLELQESRGSSDSLNWKVSATVTLDHDENELTVQGYTNNSTANRLNILAGSGQTYLTVERV